MEFRAKVAAKPRAGRASRFAQRVAGLRVIGGYPGIAPRALKRDLLEMFRLRRRQIGVRISAEYYAQFIRLERSSVYRAGAAW
jgi:hypothetical protein